MCCCFLAVRSREMRDLRGLLHQLHDAAGAGKSLSGRVTEALDTERWWDALALLHAMREAAAVPKLGAVCRWVRLCDAAHEADEENPVILLVGAHEDPSTWWPGRRPPRCSWESERGPRALTSCLRISCRNVVWCRE